MNPMGLIACMSVGQNPPEMDGVNLSIDRQPATTVVRILFSFNRFIHLFLG